MNFNIYHVAQLWTCFVLLLTVGEAHSDRVAWRRRYPSKLMPYARRHGYHFPAESKIEADAALWNSYGGLKAFHSKSRKPHFEQKKLSSLWRDKWDPVPDPELPEISYTKAPCAHQRLKSHRLSANSMHRNSATDAVDLSDLPKISSYWVDSFTPWANKHYVPARQRNFYYISGFGGKFKHYRRPIYNRYRMLCGTDTNDYDYSDYHDMADEDLPVGARFVRRAIFPQLPADYVAYDNDFGGDLRSGDISVPNWSGTVPNMLPMDTLPDDQLLQGANYVGSGNMPPVSVYDYETDPNIGNVDLTDPESVHDESSVEAGEMHHGGKRDVNAQLKHRFQRKRLGLMEKRFAKWSKMAHIVSRRRRALKKQHHDGAKLNGHGGWIKGWRHASGWCREHD